MQYYSVIALILTIYSAIEAGALVMTIEAGALIVTTETVSS